MAEIDILYIFSYIFEIGSVVNILLMSICLIKIEKIKKLFPGGNISKKWIIMQIIVLIFIIFNIFALINLSIQFFQSETHEQTIYETINYIIYGVLIIFTGIFVFIIITLNLKIYKVILHK